jgi:hypothetical protein
MEARFLRVVNALCHAQRHSFKERNFLTFGPLWQLGSWVLVPIPNSRVLRGRDLEFCR